MIKGRPLKVYKTLPASLRDFWASTEVSQGAAKGAVVSLSGRRAICGAGSLRAASPLVRRRRRRAANEVQSFAVNSKLILDLLSLDS